MMQQQIFLSLRTNERACGQIIDDHQRINIIHSTKTKRISNYKQSKKKKRQSKAGRVLAALVCIDFGPSNTRGIREGKKRRRADHTQNNTKSRTRGGGYSSATLAGSSSSLRVISCRITRQSAANSRGDVARHSFLILLLFRPHAGSHWLPTKA